MTPTDMTGDVHSLLAPQLNGVHVGNDRFGMFCVSAMQTGRFIHYRTGSGHILEHPLFAAHG